MYQDVLSNMHAQQRADRPPGWIRGLFAYLEFDVTLTTTDQYAIHLTVMFFPVLVARIRVFSIQALIEQLVVVEALSALLTEPPSIDHLLEQDSRPVL